MEHWLGIDYGTSNTVAVLRWPDGRSQPLLFDGSPLLPSVVYAAAPGQILVGRDAERQARLDPARFEPNPKRRVDERELLLADVELPLVDAVAATLRRVLDEAVRVAGAPPVRTVITYPAAWGARRRSLLVDGAGRVGLPTPTLVAEPVAAAAYFATTLGHRIPVGGRVVVYDLGAGTFDVSVVRRDPDGYAVIDVDGMPEFGGADLDALIVDRVRAVIEPAAPDVWRRLTQPVDTAARRASRMLWDDARGAKETLSRQSSVGVHVPLAERDVLLSREDFEAAATPLLQRAAAMTARVVERAEVGAAELAGLFLVGGSSRVPMVATTLHRTTGIAPTVIEQPELVVAEGALHSLRPSAPGAPPAIGAPPGPPPAVPTGMPGNHVPPVPTGHHLPAGTPGFPGPGVPGLPPPPGVAVPPDPPVNPADLPQVNPVPALPVGRAGVLAALTGVFLPVLLPLLASTMPVPVTFFDMGGSVTNALEGTGLTVTWLVLVPVVLLVSIGSARLLTRRLRRRWPDGVTVFSPWRGWIAGLSVPPLILGVLVAGLMCEMLRGVVWCPDAVRLDSHRAEYQPSNPYYHQPAIDRVADNHLELVVIGVVALLLAAAAMAGLWLFRRWSHPHLAFTPDGVQYEAAPGRGAWLPWSQLDGVEVRAPHPGAPEALVARPSQDSPLRTEPRLSALWSPEIGGFLVRRLRATFGASPQDVVHALAQTAPTPGAGGHLASGSRPAARP